MALIKCKCGKEEEQYRTDKRCLECRRAYLKAYHIRRKAEDPEFSKKKAAYKKEFFKNPDNLAKKKEKDKAYRENNREEIRRKSNEYNNRPEVKARQKEYYSRQDVRERYNAKYKNPERNAELAKKRRAENYLAKRRDYESKKYYSDELYRMSKLLRGRVSKALRRNGFPQNKRLEQVIGCSYEDLLTHLKKTWADRYPGEELIWTGDLVEVDHIIPLASAQTIDEFNKLNHFSNLQLLKARENEAKGKKVLS